MMKNKPTLKEFLKDSKQEFVPAIWATILFVFTIVFYCFNKIDAAFFFIAGIWTAIIVLISRERYQEWKRETKDA